MPKEGLHAHKFVLWKGRISLSEDILEWVDEMVKRKRFGSRSHAVKFALQKLKEEWK